MLIEPMNSTSLSSSMSLLIRAESHIVNLVFIFSYQSPPSYVVTLVSTYITRSLPPSITLYAAWYFSPELSDALH